MSKPVRLAREARAELHEAARRYGEQRPELRIEFLTAVNETMEHMVWLAKHLGGPAGHRSHPRHQARLSTVRPLTPPTSNAAHPARPSRSGCSARWCASSVPRSSD